MIKKTSSHVFEDETVRLRSYRKVSEEEANKEKLVDEKVRQVLMKKYEQNKNAYLDEETKDKNK